MATKKSTDIPAKKAVKTVAKAETKPAARAAKTPARKTAPANAATSKSTARPEPTHAEISQLAHQYWKERGHQHGSHEDDWARAEHDLRGRG